MTDKAKAACDECAKHYGDSGPCDEGKPVASPHRADAGENGYAEFHTGPGNACESGIGAESGCYRCQQFDGEEAALLAELDGTVRAARKDGAR